MDCKDLVLEKLKTQVIDMEVSCLKNPIGTEKSFTGLGGLLGLNQVHSIQNGGNVSQFDPSSIHGNQMQTPQSDKNSRDSHDQ